MIRRTFCTVLSGATGYLIATRYMHWAREGCTVAQCGPDSDSGTLFLVLWGGFYWLADKLTRPRS